MTIARKSMRNGNLILTLLLAAGSAFAKTPTVTSLSATPSSASLGRPVVLLASTSPSSATGKITFYDGTDILGSATLSNGAATFTATPSRDGKRSLTARYIGDSSYAASLSVAVTVTVTTRPGGGLVPVTAANTDDSTGTPAALADLNSDGNLDLVTVGGPGTSLGPATVWVFLGNGDGTFQAPQAYVPGHSAFAVAVADVDMDGHLDLVVAGRDGIAILIGTGDGTFKPGSNILSANGFNEVRAADVDGDGKADLVVLTGYNVDTLLGNGDGTFQASATTALALSDFPSDLLVADFNGDGVPDLAVSSSAGNSVTVKLGTGGGSFSSPLVYTSYGAVSLGVGDVNSDGKADLVVGNVGFSRFDLLLGKGDGTFAPAKTIATTVGPPRTGPTTDAGSLSIQVLDFDGDGIPDVLSLQGFSQLSAMLGDGKGAFRQPLVFDLFASNFSILLGDLNHDGIVDVVTTGSPAFIQPYLGKLTPEFTISTSPNPAKSGQDFTVTATSSDIDATGVITFTNSGGRPIGTANLLNGVASLTLNQAYASVFYLSGTYSGDSKYAPTVLPQLYFEVQQAVSITITASPNPAAPGQLITLTATLSQNAGQSSVAFLDGTTPLDVQTPYSNTVTYKTALAAGVHRLTALYPPFGGLQSASATVEEIVQAVPNGVLIPGQTFGTASTGSAALVGDFNGDGLADLAVLDTGAKQVGVYVGTGHGGFQAPRQNALAFIPGAIVAAQFNIYGLTDLAITDATGNAIAILKNYNDGTFFPSAGGNGPIPADIPVGQRPVAIAAADFNGDGAADLVTANAGSNDVSLLVTLGGPGVLDHAVNLPAGRSPSAVVTGDFNSDGNADFAVANQGDNTVMVFAGNGDGTFKTPVVTPVGAGPIALIAGDLDGDGKTDLVSVDAAANQLTVLLGKGDSAFTRYGTYPIAAGASSAVLVDLNGDNKMDLAVTTSAGLQIFTSNGNGTFSDPVTFSQYAGSASVAAGPFSGDGRMDLALSLPASHSLALLINGAPATTTLSVTPAASTMGGKVTLTATISPGNAIGAVAFYDGITQIGAAIATQGSATFTTTLLFPGPHSLSARFIGGSGFGASVSSVVGLQVSPVASSGLSGPIRQALPFNSPVNLIPGDFNKDGIEDFAFWRGGNGLIVILGNGDGTFHYPPDSESKASGGDSPVTADFNNDGNTDIAYISGGGGFARGDGAGGFSEWVGGQPGLDFSVVSLAAADFDGDGRTDLVYADPAGTADVLLGVGDSTFQRPHTFPAGTNPVLVAVGDFNEDGKPDIVVANSPQAASGALLPAALNVLTGKGDGTFTAPQPTPIDKQPVALAVADFNADGHLDVAVVHAATRSASILLGKGDGTFAPAVSFALAATPAQVLTADMDGDGHPDLIIMFTVAESAFAVLYGKGDGTFGPPVFYPDLDAPAAIAIGDVNGDGRLDVILGEPYSVNVFPGALGAISVLGGASQSAAVNTAFPVAFSVKAPAGTKVTFAAPAALADNFNATGTFPGGAASVTVTADGSGVAMAPVFTANTKPGSYLAIASAQGVAGAISFSLTNNPGPPASLKSIDGSGQTAFANMFFPRQFEVSVADAFGNGISGVSVTFTAPASGASGAFLGGGNTASQLTGPQGFADGPLFTAGTIAGTYTVTASIPGLPATVSFSVTNLSPPLFTIVSGANQSAILNATFAAPLAGKVVDALGNPVPFTPVKFTAPATGASALFVATANQTYYTVTDQQGNVQTSKLDAAGATGSYSVTATLTAFGTSAAFPLTNTPNPPGARQPQSISFPPVPQHYQGDPPFTISASSSSGLPLTFSVTYGPATVSGSTVTLTGLGTVIIQASQAGDATYLPADPVTQGVFVGQPPILIQALTSAASYLSGAVAPNELVSLFGSRLSTKTDGGDAATTLQLDGVSVTLTDISGRQFPAGLSYISPSQLNVLIPDGASLGPATLDVTSGNSRSALYPITVAAVAPALFTADASGSGVAAAFATVVMPDQTTRTYPMFQCTGNPAHCSVLPLDLSVPGSKAYLTLYGTGLRGNGDPTQASVSIGGTPMVVTYRGSQPSYAGLDQVNVELAPALAGRGQLALQLTVEGVAAKPVQVSFQ